MKLTDTKMQFIELRAKGFSYDKIAQRLKKSKQTLINWSKELECEISNFKAIELEVLTEKFRMSKRVRLEMFGKMLESIKTELLNRDLSKIPTDKLLQIFIKYLTFAQTEDLEQLFMVRETYAERDLRYLTEWKP